jgi:hypothetical protein
MKNFLRIFSLVIIAFALFNITGCEKKDKDDGVDKKALLTGHIWNFDQLTTTSTNSDIQFGVNLIAAFMTNATLSVFTNGTYTMTILGEAGNGTWEFNANETSVILDKGTADEVEQQIIQITSAALELKEMVQDSTYGNFDMTYLWIK